MGANEANEFWLDAKVTDGNSLAMSDIAAYRYQLDLAGLSGTTWGGLRWKLCSGPSLVFKVNAWAMDWWYDTIEPWKHYIPVKEDLSDLHEQWLWAEQHPEQAKEIAEEGQRVCMETSTEESIDAFTRNVLDSLPEASEACVKEADNILDGILGPNKLVKLSETA